MRNTVHRQMNPENLEQPNIPVLGLSLCGHSVTSLLSTSTLISMEFPPMNTQQALALYAMNAQHCLQCPIIHVTH